MEKGREREREGEIIQHKKILVTKEFICLLLLPSSRKERMYVCYILKWNTIEIDGLTWLDDNKISGVVIDDLQIY